MLNIFKWVRIGPSCERFRNVSSGSIFINEQLYIFKKERKRECEIRKKKMNEIKGKKGKQIKHGKTN
jgi:hypothetical protein